ncbi:hypothetical protein FACS1894106_2350 [Spirochaetia bacterium]|nr:hypothetical protein FACS1894106_2350 [Spirochaetia bacterium]
MTKATTTKESNKFTDEEKAILRRLHALRAKREKEMEGMTSQERYEYIHNIELETQARLAAERR